METEPDSLLTRERPDIWARGLALLTSHTSLVVLPKVPTPEGVDFACGGAPDYVFPPPVPALPVRREKTPEEINKEIAERSERDRQKRISDLEQMIAWKKRDIEKARQDQDRREKELAELEAELARQRRGVSAAGFSVHVPEGAMEWLLHEMGHWVAATHEERSRPNYGIGQTLWGRDAEQEWQAWGFEEIILAPWGHARHFAPPSQQDGVGFSKAGPIAASHLDHAERQMRALGVDVEQWRAVYGEWIRWERRRSSTFGLS